MAADDVLDVLASVLPKKRYTTAPSDRLPYSRDMMMGLLLEEKSGHPQRPPDAVCFPKNTAELIRLVRSAARHRIPLIPFGAGSGVSGGIAPVLGGISVDLRRLNRIGKIVRRGSTYTVISETGVIGEEFEKTLNRRGFTLGHFPSSIMCSTIGGYLACRSAGQMSSKYGKIEDMTEEIEVVLPTGRLLPLGQPLKEWPTIRPKDLFLGTEGCLGILTRVRLKVHPLPSSTSYRGVSFPRLKPALEAVQRIMQSDLKPSVVRLYDPLDTRLLLSGYRKETKGPSFLSKLSGWLPALPPKPDWIQFLAEAVSSKVVLILGFEGDSSLVKQDIRKALTIAARSMGQDLGEGPGLHWFRHRYSVASKLPALIDQGGFADTIEVATTWRNLWNLYARVKTALAQNVMVLAHFSHAYAEGCSIYFTIVGKRDGSERDLKHYQSLWHDAMEAALECGATISHHHGIGLLKARYLPKELGAGMDLYREFKKRLDPHNIMNPGKMGL